MKTQAYSKIKPTDKERVVKAVSLFNVVVELPARLQFHTYGDFKYWVVGVFRLEGHATEYGIEVYASGTGPNTGMVQVQRECGNAWNNPEVVFLTRQYQSFVLTVLYEGEGMYVKKSCCAVM
jgi:hypothetical protein